jgi:hypothetical protein
MKGEDEVVFWTRKDIGIGVVDELGIRGDFGKIWIG